MNTLIFDTETSGLPTSYKASFSDVRAWPRIVEIAWVMIDSSLRPVTSSQFIVRPDGFEISAGAGLGIALIIVKVIATSRPLEKALFRCCKNAEVDFIST